jgi:hypothetical protein
VVRTTVAVAAGVGGGCAGVHPATSAVARLFPSLTVTRQVADVNGCSRIAKTPDASDRPARRESTVIG